MTLSFSLIVEIWQGRAREQTRQAAADVSPRRRRRGPDEHEEDVDELAELDGRAENNRRMTALRQMEKDPNSSVLMDPAAVAVLRPSTARASCSGAAAPSRPTRQLYKCPYAGCVITRNSQEAISAHIEKCP